MSNKAHVDLIPTVSLTGFDEIFAQTEAIDEALGHKKVRPKARRLNNDEIVEKVVPELRARFNRSTSILPSGSRKSTRLIVRYRKEFIAMHVTGEVKGGKALVGKECTKEGIVSRLQDFIQVSIKDSARYDDEDRLIVNPSTGKPKYTSKSALHSLVTVVIQMTHHIPYPPMNTREFRSAEHNLRIYEADMCAVFALTTRHASNDAILSDEDESEDDDNKPLDATIPDRASKRRAVSNDITVLPGTLGPLNFASGILGRVGLGYGLIGTEHLSFKTDKIPKDLVDEDGLLKERPHKRRWDDDH